MRRILPILCLFVVSQSLIAQPASDSWIVERVGGALIAFSDTLGNIAGNAKSIGDIEKAAPRIEAAIDRVTSLCAEVADRIRDTAAVKDIEVAMQDLGNVMSDFAVVESINRLKTTMLTLKKERPEIAERLDDIGEMYREKITAAARLLQEAIYERERRDAIDKLEGHGR